MTIRHAFAATSLLAAILLGSAGGASAQLFNRPPGGVQGGDPMGANDPAALMLRIERLENQIRALTGQLEESQFHNRRLEEQVRRLQEASTGADPAPSRAGPPQRRSEGFEPAPSPGLRARGDALELPPPASPRGRGDAFDPLRNPGAPGSPRVLGSVDRQAGLSGPLGDPMIEDSPYEADPSAPLDLLNPRRPAVRAPVAQPEVPPLLPEPAPVRAPQRQQTAMPVDPAPNAPASTLPPPGPREQLDAANNALRAGELERAEAAYKEFLQRYPTSRLVAEATFGLGDVYARRGRHRDAAEQFLKVTTDYPKATQAASSLHRLGQSLERLGAKEQACAAWAEVPRKYPTAPQTIRTAAERDIKRASC
jgi:tol-pal system protein YbgF